LLQADVKEPGATFKDSDGNSGWELGKKRRVSVQKFKGKEYVSIREYYEKDGKV
jgi:Transcriptional Coactivator p15 (PC4)